MNVESAYDRLRKRIVEHTITGFSNAKEAVVFGNTVERIVIDKVGYQKFRQQIGAPGTSLAITPEWISDTVLKTTFLELPDNNIAQFICDAMKRAMKTHNEVHRASLRVANEVIRDKPQPQFIGN